MSAESEPTRTDAGLIDARPSYPASNDSLWDRATIERDRIAARLDETLRAVGILAWVRKSKPGEYPLFVLVDNWRPTETEATRQTTERSSLKVVVEVEPFRMRPLTYTCELKRQRKRLHSSYWALSDDELTEMARYLVSGGRKPKFFKSRIHPVLMVLATLFPLLIPLLLKRNQLVPEARPRRLTPTRLMVIGGALGGAVFWSLGQEAYGEEAIEYFMMTGLFGLLAAIGVYNWWRRPRHQSVPVQSNRTPRQEFLVDSWHVCVPEAGRDFDAFETRLGAAISAADPSIEIHREIHQALGPRGFEERERHVLTKGQANVHVHIYSFGRDAFVGWDGYMNWARWEETSPVSARVNKGVTVEYCSLKAGDHIPTEFDLIELNALSELVHRALVREVKAFLKEKEIEADLDFQIIRGDRDRALEAGKTTQKKSVRKYFSKATA